MHSSVCLSVGFQRERGIAPTLNIDRRIGFRLSDNQQLFTGKLEYGEKRHYQPGNADAVVEQHCELEKAPRLEKSQQSDHLASHRQLLPRDQMMAVDAG